MRLTQCTCTLSYEIRNMKYEVKAHYGSQLGYTKILKSVSPFFSLCMYGGFVVSKGDRIDTYECTKN